MSGSLPGLRNGFLNRQTANLPAVEEGSQLREAVARGFRDPDVLGDLVFAPVRALPESSEVRSTLAAGAPRENVPR
jgi:hypothetical protein